MNAEELAKVVALQIKSAVSAQTGALQKRIDELEAMVKAIPPARDGRDSMIPGPPGRDGQDGKDGIIRVEDIPLEYDGERTLTILGKSIRLPIPIYRGVYQSGSEYEAEDAVTYGGSVWRCKAATTTAPGNGSAEWMLMVKAGRNGLDYKGK